MSYAGPRCLYIPTLSLFVFSAVISLFLSLHFIHLLILSSTFPISFLFFPHPFFYSLIVKFFFSSPRLSFIFFLVYLSLTSCLFLHCFSLCPSLGSIDFHSDLSDKGRKKSRERERQRGGGTHPVYRMKIYCEHDGLIQMHPR